MIKSFFMPLAIIAILVSGCTVKIDEVNTDTNRDDQRTSKEIDTSVYEANNESNVYQAVSSEESTANDEPTPNLNVKVRDDQIYIQPIILVPADRENFSDSEQKSMEERLNSFMEMAQERYLELLGSTFILNAPETFKSTLTSATFNNLDGEGQDYAHRVAAALLGWRETTRDESNEVYVVIYARPLNKPCGVAYNLRCYGGARPLNGTIKPGPGIVLLESRSLMDDNQPFLSTLVHELGHAFGLTHVNCHGRDLYTDSSLMSYNKSHHSKGFEWGENKSGDLGSEEYYILSLNKRVFPKFEYDRSIHNPTGRELVNITACYIPPMLKNIDYTIPLTPGKGYELFHNSKMVAGKDAANYTWEQAQSNCKWNVETYNRVKAIRCSYNGEMFREVILSLSGKSLEVSPK